MICAGDDDEDPFPVEDCLFAETFSQDTAFTLFGQELRIQQVFGGNLGVAAAVWEAALHLCSYLEERSVEVRGRRVIELGAGTGVVGILAARLGAVVTLTDLPLTLPQLEANVSANTPSSGWPATLPTVLPLSWGQDHMNFPSDWDLVLCADIIYLPETYPLLVRTLAHLCKNTAVVYLSSKMRKEHETPRFFEECLPSRFNVELVHLDGSQNINIYRASLRKDLSQDLD
ncbi:EEF1A lysine methyltransferase 3-like [Pungitius pungitius]|uniref:EEF1A lysine methyltransferase 3-like n=1 Tax=Pungitius pungitius TaxID=134920 RepID=UPI002E158A5E